MHSKGFLDVVIDSLNVQGYVVLSFFGTALALHLVKLQVIDILRWDKQATFKETKLGSKFRNLKG